MIKEFRYIYNMEQANFYIQNGLVPVEVGTGAKKDVFLKFKDGEELQMVFKLWMERKYS
ncbi:hypothetical protein OSC52_00265 [Clostridium pasteurianum]|uniref:hypothetical protein n=1 Tax=Clostridium pasteurianum TaxID=1501 RepID=UPI002260BED7|nr:hypothetical protein [Clostridium pasteurianum]UZW14340.1 hypothetical protein OSC52_00265 [Clostridium pasteurianum]